VTGNKLKAVFKDISRLFGKLHSSNSDNEILSAVHLIEKKLEKVGLHIGDLGEFLQPEDLMSVLARLMAKDADILVELARAQGKFFSTSDRKPYVDLSVGGHRETFRLDDPQFEFWLRHQFHLDRKKAPPSSALKACLATLEADAHFGGNATREVYLRVARTGDHVYLDLGDRSRHVVEITPSGWGIIGEAPVRFRRTASMVQLPMPVPGGSIGLLRQFCNLNDDSFVLFVCALVDALFEGHPHPVIFLAGEEGVAKTTLAKIARKLVDPNKREAKSSAAEVE
jgi:hypothetical protein